MSINWSMFASATSVPQVKQNSISSLKCIEEGKKFGQCTGGMELITNFCAMHLGANLGKGNADRKREHKQVILFINLLSYSVNMVYQNTVWESYS